jgi:hypothetical protein
MNNFYHAPETRKARRKHRCTYCGEEILRGTEYVHQTGVYNWRWYRNKMHPECFGEDWYADSGFTPYSNERPVRDQA